MSVTRNDERLFNSLGLIGNTMRVIPSRVEYQWVPPLKVSPLNVVLQSRLITTSYNGLRFYITSRSGRLANELISKTALWSYCMSYFHNCDNHSVDGPVDNLAAGLCHRSPVALQVPAKVLNLKTNTNVPQAVFCSVAAQK